MKDFEPNYVDTPSPLTLGQKLVNNTQSFFGY